MREMHDTPQIPLDTICRHLNTPKKIPDSSPSSCCEASNRKAAPALRLRGGASARTKDFLKLRLEARRAGKPFTLHVDLGNYVPPKPRRVVPHACLNPRLITNQSAAATPISPTSTSMAADANASSLTRSSSPFIVADGSSAERQDCGRPRAVNASSSECFSEPECDDKEGSGGWPWEAAVEELRRRRVRVRGGGWLGWLAGALRQAWAGEAAHRAAGRELWAAVAARDVEAAFRAVAEVPARPGPLRCGRARGPCWTGVA